MDDHAAASKAAIEGEEERKRERKSEIERERGEGGDNHQKQKLNYLSLWQRRRYPLSDDAYTR